MPVSYVTAYAEDEQYIGWVQWCRWSWPSTIRTQRSPNYAFSKRGYKYLYSSLPYCTCFSQANRYSEVQVSLRKTNIELRCIHKNYNMLNAWIMQQRRGAHLLRGSAIQEIIVWGTKSTKQRLRWHGSDFGTCLMASLPAAVLLLQCSSRTNVLCGSRTLLLYFISVPLPFSVPFLPLVCISITGLLDRIAVSSVAHTFTAAILSCAMHVYCIHVVGTRASGAYHLSVLDSLRTMLR